MSELVDRIPGEIILASFHNQVKERTMMRYATLPTLEASVPIPDPGSFAYVTTYPWPMPILNTPGDGSPFVWAEDTGAGGSPFGAGFRWASLLTDRGGFVYGALAFRGDLDGASQIWSFDSPASGDFRLRILNAQDGLSGVSAINLKGDAGGANYLRRPDTDATSGRFEIRDRTGSIWQVGSGRFQATDGEVWDGALLFPNAHEDDPNHVPSLVFSEGGGTVGTTFGMYMADAGLIGMMVLARFDSSAEQVLAIPGIVSSSSENWRVGTQSVNTPGGATAYRIERQGGSSRRWKDLGPAVADAGGLAELGALEARQFTYKPGYLQPDDERDGVPMWGLVAEQVAEVNPALADHDAGGEPRAIQWEQITALLVAGYQDLRSRISALEMGEA